MRKLLIYTILAAFALASCARENVPGPSGEGTGDLIVRIAAPKATGTKAGTAADGDVMDNLHIWIVDPTEKVVRYASWSGTDGDIVMNVGKSIATATFTNIARNTYTVYLIANKPSGLMAPAVDATIGDDFKKYVLTGFESKAPSFGKDGMPLSLVESISISAGSNSLSAELVRACGRIRVSVRNNTLDKNIFLQSVALGEKNPDRGYLFQQDDHSVPSDIGYVGFKDSFSYTTAGETVSEYVAPGEVKTIIDQYIYESGVDAVADMGLQFAGGVFEKTATSAELDDVTSHDYSVDGSEFKAFYSGYISNDGLYLIRNCAQNYFLKSDGTIMREKFHSSVNDILALDNVKEYLWKFNYSSILSSGTGPSKSPIQNYSTGTYVNFTNSNSTAGAISLTSNSQTFIIGTQSKGMLIRYDNTNDKVYCQYVDNAQVITYSTADDIDQVYWYMTKVTETPVTSFEFVDALKTFKKSLPNINYVNDFGVSVPLTQICRNEDVSIVINVFYNPEFALVYFDVEAWTGVDNETTFD
ncbi:MAG: hypothetical protein ACI4AE_01215 [Candidatus Cryptobacteroides sp.]